jgi:hypothetical protein
MPRRIVRKTGSAPTSSEGEVGLKVRVMGYRPVRVRRDHYAPPVGRTRVGRRRHLNPVPRSHLLPTGGGEQVGCSRCHDEADFGPARDPWRP